MHCHKDIYMQWSALWEGLWLWSGLAWYMSLIECCELAIGGMPRLKCLCYESWALEGRLKAAQYSADDIFILASVKDCEKTWRLKCITRHHDQDYATAWDESFCLFGWIYCEWDMLCWLYELCACVKDLDVLLSRLPELAQMAPLCFVPTRGVHILLIA